MILLLYIWTRVRQSKRGNTFYSARGIIPIACVRLNYYVQYACAARKHTRRRVDFFVGSSPFAVL